MSPTLCFVLIYCSCIGSTISNNAPTKYDSTWESLDNRPLPTWYDEAKLGVFMHWGVYSVPGVKSEWFWNYWNDKNPEVVRFMKANYKPGFQYQDFASLFTATFFNATHLANIIHSSGANILGVITYGSLNLTTYTPDWKSLESRPIPQWYSDAKLGIFMHWGAYSYVGLRDAWFWYYWKGPSPMKDVVQYMKTNFPPKFQYQEFANRFTAQFFNANAVAQLVRASGAKYVVPTSKHHEGYTMWPSKYSWNWNSKDIGPNRDLVGELERAFRTKAPDVHFGLYYSLYEWFHPLYLKDKASKWENKEYVEDVMKPQMREIVETYKPEVIFSDGDWEAPDSYWDSKDFLAWLYNSSPVKDTVVVNDRWGKGDACKHGGYFTCNDRYNPGKLQKRKWENAMTIDKSSWGYRRNIKASETLTIEALLATFIQTISCGGNMLMNVGPTADGTIIPIFEERLLQMGEWLKHNGEAVYASKPWIYQNDTLSGKIWYTSKLRSSDSGNKSLLFNPQEQGNTIVYAFITSWNNVIKLGAPRATEKTKVSLLGYPGYLKFKPLSASKGIAVSLSDMDWTKLPTLWAWVLKLEYLGSENRNPLQYV